MINIRRKPDVQRCPVRRFAFQQRAVGLIQLLDKNFAGPSVKNNMVHAEKQHRPLIRFAEECYMDQRLIKPEFHRLDRRRCRIKRRLQAVEFKLPRRQDFLLRFRGRNTHPQRLMPCFQQGKRFLKKFPIHRTVQPGGKRNQINFAVLMHPLQEPNAHLAR